MILSKLQLENFKRYTSYTILFEDGLVGIIGKNGSGKSTIFEAILFALYGELQNKGYKEIIRNSNATTKDPVVVELEFEFESIDYKIIREFRGKALSANAKFYKNGELITTGAKEVTSSVIKLTHMNKEAFLSTLFASQKELTTLSSKKPEDRKKMIRRLLGLEKIDFIEKELIEKSRELKREIAAFAEVLLSNEEVKLKQEQIKQSNDTKQTLQKDVEVKSKELDSTKLLNLDIKKQLQEYIKTKELKQKAFNTLELLQNTINSHKQNYTKQTQELDSLAVKQKELRGLESVKTEYTSLHNSIKEQEKLKEYALKKEGLKKEQVVLREQYTKSKNEIAQFEEQIKGYDEYIQKEKELSSSISVLDEEIKAYISKEHTLNKEISGEEKLIQDISSKIETIQNLGRESACPTCTRPLLEEYDKVLDSLHSIIQESKSNKLEKATIELKEVQKNKTAKEERRNTLGKEQLEVSKRINLIENQKRDMLKEKEHFEKISDKGMENKKALEELEQYSYDTKEHEALNNRFQELKSKYEYVLSLETMLRRVDILKEELEATQKNIKENELKYHDKELEYKQIAYDKDKHEAKQKESETNAKDIETKTSFLNEQKVKIAKCEGEIKTIQESLDNNTKQLAKVQTKKDDLLDYDKIKVSLSEFKTKLNSKIAPRISSFASDMYSRITKGKYQHIEVSNDFDFYIYDEGVKYPIDRFSGGEIDLANLVLRIAISKTLRELSGASSIGFLAFDEVFGSQDEARRMEILEAFHTIKEQYRQIFLISHEMEIKEMFEKTVEL